MYVVLHLFYLEINVKKPYIFYLIFVLFFIGNETVSHAQNSIKKHDTSYRLCIQKVSVPLYKRNGKPWDVGTRKEPDLYIKLWHHKNLLQRSNTCKDQYQCMFRNLCVVLEDFIQAQGIEIEVWEHDLMQDDLVYRWTPKFTLKTLTASQPIRLESDSFYGHEKSMIDLMIKQTPTKQTIPKLIQKTGSNKTANGVDHDCSMIPKPPKNTEIQWFMYQSIPFTTIQQRIQATVVKKQKELKAIKLDGIQIKMCSDVLYAQHAAGQLWVQSKAFDSQQRSFQVLIHRSSLFRLLVSKKLLKTRVYQHLCQHVFLFKSPECPR